MKWVTASAALLVASAAQAVDCPKLVGLNASNVLEYCDANNVHHFMALSDSVGAPTPVATYAYAAPTAVPTFAYTAPTPVPTATPPPQLTAVYNPASLAAATTRCDTVTVTGIVSSKTVIANAGVAPATGCVIASVRASATNSVEVCWRNAIAATTACDTASSTWTFVQFP